MGVSLPPPGILQGLGTGQSSLESPRGSVGTFPSLHSAAEQERLLETLGGAGRGLSVNPPRQLRGRLGTWPKAPPTGTPSHVQTSGADSEVKGEKV